MNYSPASLESFGDFLLTDSGIVSLVSLVATIFLGCVALWIARKHQTTNAEAAQRHHNELVGKVVALATDIAASTTQENLEPPSQQAGGDPREPSQSTIERPRWRSGPFLAADVTGNGTLDLVTQHRSPTETKLRLFRIDERLQPRPLGSLTADASRRFAVDTSCPAAVATRDSDGNLLVYEWSDEGFVQVDNALAGEIAGGLTSWPTS